MLLIWVSTWPALGPPSGQSLHVCLPDGRDGKEYIKLSYHLISIIHFCFCYVKNITALKGCYIFLVLLITASLLRQISSCFPWYASLLKVFFLIINKKNQITVCLLFGHLYVCISLSAVFCSTDTLNYSHWPLLHLTASFFFISSALSLYSCPLMPKPDSIQVRLAWRRSAHTSSHPPCPGVQWGTTRLWNQPTQTAPPPFQPTTHGASPAQVKK